MFVTNVLNCFVSSIVSKSHNRYFIILGKIQSEHRHLRVIISKCYLTAFRRHVPSGIGRFPSCSACVPFSLCLVCVLLCRRCSIERLNMASDGPPGTESAPSDLGSAIAALNTWSNPELQSKLGELGAPAMGKKGAGKRSGAPVEVSCLANRS